MDWVCVDIGIWWKIPLLGQRSIEQATQYDKLKRNYESMIAMAYGYLWLSM